MTVAGCTVPSASNTCVMPIFLPMIPVTMKNPVVPGSTFHVPRSRFSERTRTLNCGTWNDGTSFFVFLPDALGLDVDAGRKIQLHQGVDGLRRRLEDVDEPLVRPDFKL